ncbi:hypothetical protein NIES4074_04230 [Cylindrospermum sp. NIES-4074]|nr:hypothetical protein NIES4074_04230 [Cylindrospermum sp. NIES-4074]
MGVLGRSLLNTELCKIVVFFNTNNTEMLLVLWALVNGLICDIFYIDDLQK